MKRNSVIPGLLCVALFAGCATVQPRRAMVDSRVISNPFLGLFGFSFEIPDGVELYNPAIGNAEQYGELQQMAIRIYNLNRNYHPRGNEIFYDSFLMLSEQTGVLLMTLKVDDASLPGASFSFDENALQGDQIPLYNVDGQEMVQLGGNRADAFHTRGHAYEHKGWYYAKKGRRRNLFQYEACKVSGGNRDQYVLMGFCLPGDEKVLEAQMQEMMEALRF